MGAPAASIAFEGFTQVDPLELVMTLGEASGPGHAADREIIAIPVHCTPSGEIANPPVPAEHSPVVRGNVVCTPELIMHLGAPALRGSFFIQHDESQPVRVVAPGVTYQVGKIIGGQTKDRYFPRRYLFYRRERAA